MENAFSWLGEIIRWVGAFIPRLLIVRATERGVKWVHGKHVKAMQPGLHFYWPVVTEYTIRVVARQTLNMPAQTLITKDKKQVVVAGMVVYNVNDIVKAIGEQSWDVDNTVGDLTQAAIVGVVTNTNFDELSKLDDQIIDKLTDATRKKLKKFGVYIEKCFLTDFCTTQVIRIVQNASMITQTSD